MEKSYDELTKLLSEHDNSKPSILLQRFRFNSRVRQQSESVATFVAALQKTDFGGTLKDMLRDRLVCGINQDRIQQKQILHWKLHIQRSGHWKRRRRTQRIYSTVQTPQAEAPAAAPEAAPERQEAPVRPLFAQQKAESMPKTKC